jgi:hypothetical protein
MITPTPIIKEVAHADWFFCKEPTFAAVWPPLHTELDRCLSLLLAGREVKLLSNGFNQDFVNLPLLIRILRGLNWPIRFHEGTDISSGEQVDYLRYFLSEEFMELTLNETQTISANA